MCKPSVSVLVGWAFDPAAVVCAALQNTQKLQSVLILLMLACITCRTGCGTSLTFCMCWTS